MSLKDAYVEIAEQRDAAMKAYHHHLDLSMDLRRRVTHLDGILVTLRDQVCTMCRGRGEDWVNYAQDDTKMMKCLACGGTGLPK